MIFCKIIISQDSYYSTLDTNLDNYANTRTDNTIQAVAILVSLC